jgi:hypothetical protein
LKHYFYDPKERVLMNIPWTDLPERVPYIFDLDRSTLKKSEMKKRKNRTEFDFELLPEPFLGTPNAPVVLLNLNPGYKESDIEFHKDPLFIKLSLGNLNHAPMEYPFYLLDPRIADSSGASWWLTK